MKMRVSEVDRQVVPFPVILFIKSEKDRILYTMFYSKNLRETHVILLYFDLVVCLFQCLRTHRPVLQIKVRMKCRTGQVLPFFSLFLFEIYSYSFIYM